MTGVGGTGGGDAVAGIGAGTAASGVGVGAGAGSTGGGGVDLAAAVAGGERRPDDGDAGAVATGAERANRPVRHIQAAATAAAQTMRPMMKGPTLWLGRLASRGRENTGLELAVVRRFGGGPWPPG